MILADKIITLRKKAGWSQQELADQLNVSRQSVSKWEGAQSIPDIGKIIQMSQLFGVTTDYLLKDELAEEEYVQSSEEVHLRKVTMEEASLYLDLRKEAAPKMALATFLCIISPVCLIFLAVLSEVPAFPVSEDAAAGIGLCVLLGLVAAGVAIFLSCGSKVKEFEFLEKEPFETEYGVAGMVKERKRAFQDSYTRLNIFGTVLCILSAVPIFVSMCIGGSDLFYVAGVCALLFLVGIGCIAFVYGGTYHGAMERLLEEGDYTRTVKAGKGVRGAISAVYWLVVTAIFLFCLFGPSGNYRPDKSWIIWAIAGVLYGAVMVIVSLIQKSKK